MPDEFASAYREAYERALREQPEALFPAQLDDDADDEVGPATQAFEAPVPAASTGPAHGRMAPGPQAPDRQASEREASGREAAEPEAAEPPSSDARTLAPEPSEPRAQEPPTDDDSPIPWPVSSEEPTRQVRVGTGTHRAVQPAGAPGLAALRGGRWFVPAILLVVALLLILAAYLLGRLFSNGVDATTPNADSSSSTAGSTSGSTSGGTTRHAQPYRGAVQPVTADGARAACMAKPGVDSAGHQVTYQVGNVLDDNPRTAWRCDGAAVGQRIRLHFDRPVRIGQVGLIPGYAKTDAKSHADRYAQNNRITKLRWTIGDTQVVQTMSGNKHDRSLRTMRIPATKASEVTLEVLAVKKGPRNTTCISTVRIGAARS